MKRLLIPFVLLIAASICYAASNITFSGGGYDISVLLSDEDCKVVGLNVSGDDGSIISVETKDLAAFSKAESDCKKKTIHLVVPATKSHPYFELKSASKNGHITLGEKKVNVAPDWQM
jgi:predicted small secreted protein